MAVYKVPQDIEAEDKLLGPFSFRQFVYLLVVAMAIGIGYMLAKVFIGLAVLVLPIVIFFGALALPLKKDQPMEVYLGALVSFYFLKPRKRIWQPDGLESLIEITVPKSLEEDRVKHLSQDEARDQLEYLSDIVESRGWSVRGIGVPTQGMSEESMNMVATQPMMNPAMDYNQPVQAPAQPQPQMTSPADEPDILDSANPNAQRFNQMLDTRDQQGIAEVRDNFQEQMAWPPPAALPQLQESPYPPLESAAPQPALAEQSTSTNDVNPDIMRLANESEDLTVATVATQAHFIEKEHGLPDDEVEISLH